MVLDIFKTVFERNLRLISQVSTLNIDYVMSVFKETFVTSTN